MARFPSAARLIAGRVRALIHQPGPGHCPSPPTLGRTDRSQPPRRPPPRHAAAAWHGAGRPKPRSGLTDASTKQSSFFPTLRTSPGD